MILPEERREWEGGEREEKKEEGDTQSVEIQQGRHFDTGLQRVSVCEHETQTKTKRLFSSFSELLFIFFACVPPAR